ncbi:MAG: ArnT family glycosyltransferase [Alphaproteobacteria bacterium]
MKKLLLWTLAITLFRVIILVLSPLELSFDEAQYWHWSKDLSFGYFSKPPVIAYLIYLTTSICGNGEACVRLASPLMHGATSLMVYLAASKLFDKKTGYFSALTYLTLTGVSFGSNLISTDVPLLFCYAAAIYFLSCALTANHWKWWLALGAVTGIGLLSKYSMAIFPAVVLIYMLLNYKLYNPKHYLNFFLMLLLAIAIYSPNFYWNYTHHFASYAHTKANTNLGSGMKFNPLKALEFLGSQIAVFGIILFPCFLFFIAKPFQNMSRLQDKELKINRFGLLFLLSAPLIIAMTILGLISRANANWAAPSYVAGVILVTALLIHYEKLKLVKFSIYLNCGLMIMVSLLLITGSLTNKHKLSGWKDAGKTISQIAKNNSDKKLLFDERKILTPFLYYLEPQQFDHLVKWNPNQELNDHYDLTASINNHDIGNSFIYISRWDNADSLMPYFSSMAPMTPVIVKHGSKKQTKLYITILKGFNGLGSLNGDDKS